MGLGSIDSSISFGFTILPLDLVGFELVLLKLPVLFRGITGVDGVDTAFLPGWGITIPILVESFFFLYSLVSHEACGRGVLLVGDVFLLEIPEKVCRHLESLAKGENFVWLVGDIGEWGEGGAFSSWPPEIIR